MSVLSLFGEREFSIGSRKTDGYRLLANFSTFNNFLCGVIITGVLVFNILLSRHWLVRLLVFGASWDAIDGKFARRSKYPSTIGKQLDTYADLMTFALAPTLMIVNVLEDFSIVIAVTAASLYLFGASFRLSRFMLGDSSGSFNGMPSPVAAIFIAAFYYMYSLDNVFTAFSVIFIAIIMMSNLKFTAMKTVNTIFDAVHFVYTIALMLVFTYAPTSWFTAISIQFIVYIYYFIIFGPLHARIRQL